MARDPADIGEQTDVRQDVDALKADIAALRRDINTLVQDLVAAGKERAGNAGQTFSDAARSRLDQWSEDWEGISGRGHELLDTVQDQIERHPLASLGIAFLIGMVLSSVLRRR